MNRCWFLVPAAVQLRWTKWLLSDGIGNRVAVALAHLVASYSVGYIIAVAIAYLITAYGVGYGVPVAVAYLIAAHGIGYVVTVAVAYLIAAHCVHNFIAIASANLLCVCSTAAARTNVGVFAGAEQCGYEYVKEFPHFLMYHCSDVYIMIKDKTGRVSMLHIVDDFTVFYVREHLTFLFLRER